ncbi:MAG: glycosyltransferase family 2 protein [Lachnospiraceae bacterium]|nr:glycosyltransferase family 2 protein [Lachnospiraceae bacterium]
MSVKEKPILGIVVPCYNEEEALPDSAEALEHKLSSLIEKGSVSEKSFVLFSNDGSKDGTAAYLHEICHKNPHFYMVDLLKNVGHQYALLAGMQTAAEFCDAVITIDADLQQDVEAMDAFLESYQKGYEVVYGVRNDRSADGFFKKMTAGGFYGLMHLLGADIKSNSADYRLMSADAVRSLSEYGESNLFLRGLIPYMGYPSDTVYFDVKERQKGQSKYTFSKMLTLALDGITSFSDRPLKLIGTVGVLMFLFSLGMILHSVITYFLGANQPGYTTTVISIWMVGGLLMISMGVLGAYIGKIYTETKRRPRYLIKGSILPGKED